MKTYTRRQSRNGGTAAQANRNARAYLERKAELDALASAHGGYAKIYLGADDTLVIRSGVLSGREFFTDTRPEAIFNDGTMVGGSPWFLE